ncbi:hypothetical protein MCUN1_003943 [Malassezia cuniculi]|uniref:Uncharacterized protein n=1 Tax=Malassezia cuniculi TaxID=948313 RepID=A0AAF0JDK9_9BASI|nr:hypothetical protein MCUN1_003943 [Malassezia cuniculi]
MSTPPTAAQLVLSAAEQPVFAQLYSLADPANTGVITGDAAVRFFEGFSLPTLTLGQIWSIADNDNNGYLTPNTFGIALRLIARAQRGESVSLAAINTPGAPPTYKGAAAPSAAAAPASAATASAHDPNDVILPDDRARFARIFAMSAPQGGLITGEKAKEIFLKSKLPYDTLGSIWNLADTKGRGALDLTDFAIGMHYIQGTMNGTISSIPAVLPPGLYEQAAGIAPVPATPTAATGAPSGPVAAPAAPQTPATPAVHTPIRPQHTGASFSAAPTADWGVSAAEKAKADGFFDSLDAAKTGKLDGPLVVPFFLQSGLSETTLAHVWDLADVTQSGELSREEFAVAMKLITDKLAGHELPQTLPAALVPPSLRQHQVPQVSSLPRSETRRELFSLIDDDAPQMSPAAVANAFSAPAVPPVPPMPAAVTPSQPARQTQTRAASASFDDGFFAPGGGAAAAMGLSPSTARAVAEQPIADTGVEYGNTKIQLESTNKALSELGTRRADAEATVATGTTTLAELTAQLERARASHTTESEAVTALEAKVTAQAAEIESLHQEVIHAESELSALRTHKDELEQQLLADRETARELRQRLASIQSETASLKQANETLSREASQQSSLNTITNKQIATALEEQERSRVATPSTRRTNPFESLFGGAGAANSTASPAASVFGVSTSAPTGIATPQSGISQAPAQETPQETQPQAVGTTRAAEPAASIHSVSDADTVRDAPAPVPPRPSSVFGGIAGTASAATAAAATAPKAESSTPFGAGVPAFDDEQSSDGDEPPEDADGIRQRDVYSDSRGDVQDASFSSALTGNGDIYDTHKDSVPGSFPSMPGGLDQFEQEEPRRPAIPPSRTIDDFDSAFENMGLASVVHGSPGESRNRELGFDDAFEGFGEPRTQAPAPGVKNDAPATTLLNLDTAPAPAGSGAAAPISAAAPQGAPSLPWSTPQYAASPTTSVASPQAAVPPTSAYTPSAAYAPSTASATSAQPASSAAASTASRSSSVAQAPARVPTPPRATDSTQVRQLCNMGFSRSVVVNALDKSGQRMERALDAPSISDVRDIKARLLAALGDNAGRYWSTLSAFCSARIDRAEFDARIAEQLPDEQVPLHNALVLSMLARALEPTTDPSGSRHAAHGVHAPASPIRAPRALLGDGAEDDDIDYDPPIAGSDEPGRKRLRHMYAGLPASERERLKQLPKCPGASAASAGWAGAGAELLERKRKEDEKRRSVEERRRTREATSAVGAVGWQAAAMAAAAQAESIRPRLTEATQEAFARGVAAPQCVEAHELPDVYTIQDRMTLCAVEAGLAGGVHVQAAAVVLDALQQHLRNIISSTLAKVRPPRDGSMPLRARRMAMPDMALLFSLSPHIVVEPLGQGALERLLAPDSHTVPPSQSSRDAAGVSWEYEDALTAAAQKCATTKRAETAGSQDSLPSDLPEDPAERARFIARLRQQQRRDALRGRIIIDELAPLRLLDRRTFAESLGPGDSSLSTPISSALAQHYNNVNSHYSHHHHQPKPDHRHKGEFYEVADPAAILGTLTQ